jgi:exonuclease III
MSSKVSSTSLLSLASLNAKGLSKTEKQEELGMDCSRFKVDILCVQETKVKNHSTRYLENKYQLIMMEQNKGRHGGLGFIISPRLLPYVTDYQYTSDRVPI